MSSLPTGTITFLFTDIEGSTKRWEQYPRQMQAALARHDILLRHAIETHGGYVFKTIGDAFCAAFSSPSDALASALSAQSATQDEDWGEIGPLRVRMALHIGVADERDGDYFGPPVNRVARLLSAGHGGQTLLSEPACNLLADLLPAGVTLRDMGLHRLKDLSRIEHIFQLVAPGLLTDFPSLRTLDSRPNNLPLQPNLFIGRKKQVADVCAILRRPDVHLLTLTGTGGTGKTRLSLQAAAEMLDDFRDGVFFVPLSPVTDSDLVASTIARTLGVRESGGQPLVESLNQYLLDKQILLVLDNFEHVAEKATLLADIISTAPEVKLLVTSRVRLRLSSEHDFPVPPLDLPETKLQPLADQLIGYDSVRLFVERATAAKSDFTLTDENAPAVAAICKSLDGLPLAIELAATRIKILPPQALLSRLETKLKLLTGGAKDLPARQQTLRGAIDWSYDLLEEPEKLLFRRLAIFAGGCTFEAAEAVCDVGSRVRGEGVERTPSPLTLLPIGIDILDGMASLVDKSLLWQVEEGEGEPRFTMLETIREYAIDKLEESGEGAELRAQHASYFLTLAESAEPELRGPQQAARLNTLEIEHDNLRAALAHSLKHRDAETETATRLGSALWWFWFAHGHLSEGRRWLEAVTSDANVPFTPARAKALNGAGVLVYNQGDYLRAVELLDESLAISRELGDVRGISSTLNNLGTVAVYRGEYVQAQAFYEESLGLLRELGDKRNMANVLANLGTVASSNGDYMQMERYYEESLALQRELGDKWGMAAVLANLGEQALARSESKRATAFFRESLDLFSRLGDKAAIAECLEGLAGAVGLEEQEPIRAAELFGAAEALREVMGAPIPPSSRSRYDHNLAIARAQLDAEAWEAAWERGRSMTMEETISLALETANLS